MTTVTSRTLQHDYAALLQRARSGERIIITRFGEAVAVLVGVNDLERLKDGEGPGERRGEG